ncbi:MAG: FAD-dependent oxidoreductase [Myxococcota bacterium]|jgi:glycerol-3-phosphate dehydrogenase|nr:FAD-dependent oxidoreductase [Myxococcota bacterium]
MNRDEMRNRLDDHRHKPFDIIFIGGGCSGAGSALDAAARGHDVLLLEQSDFGKGTSSRSTKLVHGGVRYLQQGNIPLVMEALKERGIMRRNAPHLVSNLPFVVPNYTWWEAPFYGMGMKIYDMLAGRYGFGASRLLDIAQTLERIPTISIEGLRGGVIYYDGQFDDARMLIGLVATAIEQGAIALNYTRVSGLRLSAAGYVNGVVVQDLERGDELELQAKVVANCTGPFADEVRRMDDPQAQPIIAGSTGVHLVLDRSFLSGDSAIMVPHTADGRVLFAIPWRDRALIGTTDVPVTRAELEPLPTDGEIDFILENAHDYLDRPPTRADILSVFSGVRPLVRAGQDESTSALSRDHTIAVSKKGLVTIAGGKWTTYRHMAEDLVDHLEVIGDLDPEPCITRSLRIHGYHRHAHKYGRLRAYGSDAQAILDLERAVPELADKLHERLPTTCGQVAFAARREMARTLDDVLARRTRDLLLDAQAALEAAPKVAALLAKELGRDDAWQRAQVEAFERIAAAYRVSP